MTKSCRNGENHYTLQSEIICDKIYEALEDPSKATFMILTDAEYAKLRKLLQEEILRMKELYKHLTEQGIELMKVHAPAHIAEVIPTVIARYHLF